VICNGSCEHRFDKITETYICERHYSPLQELTEYVENPGDCWVSQTSLIIYGVIIVTVDESIRMFSSEVEAIKEGCFAKDC
jgi:hypothetical protein